MPERARPEEAPARAFWSGTITFGLVSIPVDLFAAVRARPIAMRLVDADGNPVGREYYCPEDEQRLSGDDLVRGYERERGELVVVTDEELASIAPDMSRDIELVRFVPLEQIPPEYFDHPYLLAPASRSTKAYHLLAQTMERTGRVGIGTFVMRGHEYLVAILAEGGILRAETLRFADELRTPETIGLPEPPEIPSKVVRRMEEAVSDLTRDSLDLDELSDRYAEGLSELARAKYDAGRDVVGAAPLAEPEAEEAGGEVVDLLRLLERRLGTSPDGRAAASGELRDLSKKELYERAKALDIEGRSKMGREQLIRAIRKAS